MNGHNLYPFDPTANSSGIRITSQHSAASSFFSDGNYSRRQRELCVVCEAITFPGYKGRCDTRHGLRLVFWTDNPFYSVWRVRALMVHVCIMLADGDRS